MSPNKLPARAPHHGRDRPVGAGSGPQAGGFTLVEVLVALVGLALMAGLSWRGLDSMMRTRDASQQRVDEVAVLQTALAQWRTDLDAATAARFFRLQVR